MENKNLNNNKDNKKANKESKFEKKLKPVEEREVVFVDSHKFEDDGIKGFKARIKLQKQLTSKYSKQILSGDTVSTTGNKPDTDKYAIELYGVRKWYTNGDMVTPILKGIDLKIEKSKFIVILGPSGSGKTTLLNVISGLDKVSEGDVFSVGSNLTLLKDSHLTMFRRENVGFIFQQYNLLSNLTAKENAEVGENLSKKADNAMSIEEIFETIGMKEQMNKYPHQMSGGQQQRVSIARALAKNPAILFGDEPTGALDEEMGRKVLEILLEVKKRFNTTIIIVTHNPNIAEIGDTIIHVRNGLIDKMSNNPNPKKPSEIDWS
ncbi:ABC transporter ATP-binding protein [Spiroplasma helicoides]|uniref:ABC transporter ATP-binding protein n=1 Tax=Spiroplasma helicoides TaxID=216938 RepID=A0A1B3SJ70_9MOLU|nr:ABC transporter ATP-binding protein [Spiroplasma helicoides]AOG59970.1 ABC transporter ATP-binding protein [Spiroplasma helicoides]